MLIVRGPAKVDLIFPDEPHSNEPPWEPEHGNLEAIVAHFWDWVGALAQRQGSKREN
jgi:hypothetical protein